MTTPSPPRTGPPAISPTIPSTKRSPRGFHLRSIRTKILGVGVVATILLAGVGGFAAVQLVDVRNHADELAAMQSSVGGALTDLKDAMWTVRMSTYAAAAALPADKAAAKDAVVEAFGDLDAKSTAFVVAFKDATGTEPAAWADFTAALASYTSLVGGEMLDAAVADNRELFSSIRTGGAAAAGTSSSVTSRSRRRRGRRHGPRPPRSRAHRGAGGRADRRGDRRRRLWRSSGSASRSPRACCAPSCRSSARSTRSRPATHGDSRRRARATSSGQMAGALAGRWLSCGP